MTKKVIQFPSQDKWFHKLSWNRAKKVAKMVEFPDEDHEITCDKETYMSTLLTHIWAMTHEWEPVVKLEELPEEVKDWFVKASELEGGTYKDRD